MEQQKPTEAALLKDLELQWRDHHHMRDQSWRTVTNTLLLFLGAVGLEMKGVEKIVSIIAYMVVVFAGVIGWSVAMHHRLRQEQKFKMIDVLEEQLSLVDLKSRILQKADAKQGFAARVFTANFIGFVELGVALIALVLLVRKIVV